MALKTVTSFIADLQVAGGPSSTNQFDLEFGCTDALNKFLKEKYGIESTVYNNLMVDMINEAQIPGVSLTSQDIKQVHKGINIKPAVAKVYNEMDFSCILDVKSDAFKFFTAWQQFIQGGTLQDTDVTSKSGKRYVRALAQNYYNDYVCQTKIKKYEKYGKKTFLGTPLKPGLTKTEQFHVFDVTLVNSYPYMLSSIPYSSGGSGVVKLSVGMYYEYAEYTPFATPDKAKYTAPPQS